ncbi:MAG: Wzz/FepE/Etk N-terminal domain-containing protein [Ktedonobacteraceae bacterium]
MTFEHYWGILVKRWKLILVCFLLVGAVTSIATKLMTPLYQSSVLVQVVVAAANNQSDYTSLLASDELVQTDAILATSSPVLSEVASHYKGLSIAQLSKEATSTVKLNTQLFEIDVLDPSPTRAADLANDVAATLVKQQYLLHSSQPGLPQSQLLVVQPAQPSLAPVQPNVLFNISAGLLAGLFLGILLAILYERLDTRVRTSEALSQLLDWPVLATIWRVRSSKQEDILNPTGQDSNVEQYRILRTNIGFSGIDKPLHSLMVTSAVPRDGKSTIAANLAIYMAKAGKTTLLIDADLRRPTQHHLFNLSSDKMGLSNAVLAFNMPKVSETPPLAVNMSTMPGAPSLPGITNAHAGQRFYPPTLKAADALNVTSVSLEPFVHTVGIPNLWIMPSGPLPPNPPELLDSKAMQRLLTVIANNGIEIVIFDTPPLLGLSDASILTSKVDGALVVVDVTRANKGNLKQVKAMLTKAGANVLGCVANKNRRRRRSLLTYSYYYSYYRADEQKNHNKKSMNFPAIPTAPVPVVGQPEMGNGKANYSARDVNIPNR